jgi:hypothetical protein
MFRLMVVALAAVCAFGVLSVASASAVVTFLLAEWLVNGLPVTTERNVEAVGTILLENTSTPLGATDVVCSGILAGKLGEDGLGVISEVLLLDETTIVSLVVLTEPGIACENTDGHCAEPLVWAENLPWNTLLELMEEGTEKFFVILIEESGTAGLPGWYVWCMKTIFEPTDLCEAKANGVSQLSLENGTLLLAAFSEVFLELAGEALATCTLSGAATGIVSSIPSELRLTGVGQPQLNASSESEDA